MNTSDVTIRPATAEDLDAIVAITEAEFPSFGSIDERIERMIGGTPWIRIKAEALREEIEKNAGSCAVAECDGKVVGYVTNVINRVALRGTIANLAVLKAYQGRGIGKKLIAWSLNRFRSLGLQQAKIETLETNEVGRHLYPSLGFREVVRQIHYVMRL
jgi:ribosomal protein S18 acetylase RimI-like enzyme